MPFTGHLGVDGLTETKRWKTTKMGDSCAREYVYIDGAWKLMDIVVAERRRRKNAARRERRKRARHQCTLDKEESEHRCKNSRRHQRTANGRRLRNIARARIYRRRKRSEKQEEASRCDDLVERLQQVVAHFEPSARPSCG